VLVQNDTIAGNHHGIVGSTVTDVCFCGPQLLFIRVG